MPGKLYCVSVGPGDPGLMTLRSVQIIKKCHVIAAPQTSSGKMLALSIAEQAVDMSGKIIVPLDFPMTKDEQIQHENHRRKAAMLTDYLDKDLSVAMLNLGDVSIYSTCSYIAAELVSSGYETEYCAGVTSFCAAASELGISLAEGNEPLIIIPAGYDGADDLISADGSKVIMKSGSKISNIQELLKKKSGRIYAAENCGFPDHKLYYDINEITECGYFTVIISKN